MNIVRILLLIAFGLAGNAVEIPRNDAASMVQTQGYRAPTYPAFLALANEAAGIAGRRAVMSGGGGAAAPFRQRDRNNDGKLDREELPGALFDRLDANKDGFVTEDELKTLWQSRQRGAKQ